MIGVTGHRKLKPDATLVGSIHSALEHIIVMANHQGKNPQPVVLSSLAEGVDRLVSRIVLEIPGSRLEAVLPMGRNEYARDFKTNSSRIEYRELLTRATHVKQLRKKDDRAENYERAGRYVVDHCDWLIAVWDGRPAAGRGGTAEIVQFARNKERPIIWIDANDPEQVSIIVGIHSKPLGVDKQAI